MKSCDCNMLNQITDTVQRRVCEVIARDAQALTTLVVECNGRIEWREGNAFDARSQEAANRCVRLGLARVRTIKMGEGLSLKFVVQAKPSAVLHLLKLHEQFLHLTAWMHEVKP